ncbi:hypothetical protein LX13_004428 [Williamsia maris]|uniref:Uncharacterized protein n=2 Tax=Williamsia maris TaxID=72806 RepID=A0ABT1HKX8_9NOCA|nr:hypothetical protein [Williamsia maris]
MTGVADTVEFDLLHGVGVCGEEGETMVAAGDDPLEGAAHAAFEVFWSDLDSGTLNRDEAIDGFAALMSIAASPSDEPSLPPDSDLEILRNTPRDAVLATLLPIGGWVVPDVDSTDGFVGRISVELSELAAIARDFRHHIVVAGLADPGELVGHFLIVRTARGETVVREFATSVMLDDAYRNTAAVWASGRRGPVL